VRLDLYDAGSDSDIVGQTEGNLDKVRHQSYILGGYVEALIIAVN